jgi:Thioredoxin-like domain
MRALKVLLTAWTLCLAALVATPGFAQYEVANRPTEPRAAVEKQAPRFTYMLFWKQQDANTQQFSETIQASAAKRGDRVNFTAVDLKDPANQNVVAHYGVSRAPMPLAICVADNGAVTGVFTRKPNDAALERALVTSAMAEATKALQDKKIVVVHVKASPDAQLPTGAADFVAEPDFQTRTTVIDVLLGDPAESRFVADMQIKPQDISDSMLVIMAPPAALVGKFASTATRDEIVTKLHAAGKCCNDPNCKHNKKTN